MSAEVTRRVAQHPEDGHLGQRLAAALAISFRARTRARFSSLSIGR